MAGDQECPVSWTRRRRETRPGRDRGGIEGDEASRDRTASYKHMFYDDLPAPPDQRRGDPLRRAPRHTNFLFSTARLPRTSWSPAVNSADPSGCRHGIDGLYGGPVHGRGPGCGPPSGHRHEIERPSTRRGCPGRGRGPARRGLAPARRPVVLLPPRDRGQPALPRPERARPPAIATRKEDLGIGGRDHPSCLRKPVRWRSLCRLISGELRHESVPRFRTDAGAHHEDSSRSPAAGVARSGRRLLAIAPVRGPRSGWSDLLGRTSHRAVPPSPAR
jgi:hypothetical protein